MATAPPTRKYRPATTFRGEAALNDVCSSIPLSDFPAPKDGIVTIASDATIADAVRVLSEKNILSAPVRDVSQPDDASWMDKYIGIIDLTDVALFMMNALEGKYDGRPSFMESLHSTSHLTAKPVTEALHVFRYGPFVPLDESSSLLDAMLILGKHGLHRLAVVRIGGDIMNIITQSALVAALRSALPRLDVVASKTLAELGLADPTEVISCRLDDAVWSALNAMKTHGVSAVPILGADGAIVGVFSNKDVRMLLSKRDMYPKLFQTLREFVAAKVAHEVDARATAVSVSPTHTLGRVVEMLAGLHLHRVFIADSYNRVTGVVSLRDVLSVLVTEPVEYFGTYFDL